MLFWHEFHKVNLWQLIILFFINMFVFQSVYIINDYTCNRMNVRVLFLEMEW